MFLSSPSGAIRMRRGRSAPPAWHGDALGNSSSTEDAEEAARAERSQDERERRLNVFPASGRGASVQFWKGTRRRILGTVTVQAHLPSRAKNALPPSSIRLESARPLRPAVARG